WAKDEKTMPQAQKAILVAEEIWPDLPGLSGYGGELGRKYQVLRVGMRDLPKYISPGMARTDAELRAVELLFESLVKASPDGTGAIGYQPGLAEGRPRVAPLGREFQLPANVFWSNNKPVTLADLRYTVRQLKEGRGCGRSIAWGDLFAERDEVSSRGDPPRVT